MSTHQCCSKPQEHMKVGSSPILKLKTVIEDVEDDMDELTDSDFAESAIIIFDKIDNGKDIVLTLSKSVDFIEKLGWGGGHSEDLAGHLQKVDPNESDSLGRFAFVKWYVYTKVSLDSAEEAESLVGWACKISLIDIQREIPSQNGRNELLKVENSCTCIF